MTIKQHGGVFGRNPTFNDVTAEGTTSLDGPVVINESGADVDLRVESDTQANALFVDGTTGYVGVGTANPTYNLVISNGGAEGLEIGPGYVGGRTLFQNYNRATSQYVASWEYASEYVWNIGGTEKMRLNTSGNLAMASGNGIDFSATAGTGTSELFDDYEEGTWTPVYDASTSSPTVTHDKQTGYYVKIGRMVFISLQLRTDSVSGGSGNLRISGLPYSAGSGDGYPSALSVGYKADFVTNGPDFAHVNDGQTYLSLYSNGTTVATPLTVANLNTGSNDNGLYISGSYLTA